MTLKLDLPGTDGPCLALASPVGALIVEERDGAIVRIGWDCASRGAATPLLREAARQLEAYFNGALTEFDLPLDPAGSPFQKRVWAAMAEIPYGETATYGSLARRLKTSARPVGGACRANPLPIVVPCHRVVAAGGTAGGYSGKGGLSTKSLLLGLEGSRGETIPRQP